MNLAAQHRREHLEDQRELEVIGRAKEILADPQELDDAVGDFGNELSFTGLFECLSKIAHCETAEQYTTQGGVLKKHLRHIAYWYAEKELKKETGVFEDMGLEENLQILHNWLKQAG